ncbi:MAG: flagellin [Opitutales bacterium]|nr:flagellin [Opitutales bacterium]
MSITINSNMASTNAALNLKRASSRLSKSIQRLSSGNRITSASDDAGGLAVAMKLQSSLRRATASMMNTQNGTSFLQMQDSVLKVAGEIIDRMSELKSFWNDVSKNNTDRETYNHEFHELQKELNSLRGQKFNGVSLFATTSNDKNSLKIITSDDGLGDPIELARVGLFENLKSKFGVDGVLNSGSQGEYRQLVGDFATDAGILDANPGFATRDYSVGEVVFRRGPEDSKAGYFMALKDLNAGVRVEDSGSVNSNWIRIADKSGKGFSEAYPTAPPYDHNNLKFNSSGEAVAYLEGDIIKVQAHWNDPNSAVFIKAESDVPRNITLDKILDEYMGDGKYFTFVGEDRTDDQTGRPTSSYIMPNSDHITPAAYDGNDVSIFAGILNSNSGNKFTPTYVQNGNNIYEPTSNWGLQEWSESGIFKFGDNVVSIGSGSNTKVVFSLSENVKGQYLGGAYAKDSFVLSGGDWYKADANVSIGVPGSVGNWTQLTTSPLADSDFATNKTDDYKNLSNDNYWTKTHFGSLDQKTINIDYKRGDNIYYQGKHYVYTSPLDSNDQAFTAGSGQSGVTSFEQLLLQGAVTELKLYVDTVGGGGASGLAHGVYYKPKQELEYIDRLPNSGLVQTNSIERRTDPGLGADGVYNSKDDLFYGGLNPGGDGIYGTMDDYYTTTAFSDVAKQGGHIDSDADNNKDLLDTSNGLENFSVADFVDYIQTIANFRAVTGGTLTRLDYASRMLEENQINLEAAHGRIMDADMAKEAAKMAQQNVLLQAGAAMVSQANQLNQVVLQLLQ